MLLHSRLVVRIGPVSRSPQRPSASCLGAVFSNHTLQTAYPSHYRNAVQQRCSSTKRFLRLMPLGGSITQGVGSTDLNGYRVELVRLLRARNYSVQMLGSRSHGTMEDNAHEGWRGFRLDQIKRKAETCINSEMQPNIFAINAGSNDCLQDFKMSSIGPRMLDLLEFLWTTVPGSTAIMSTLVVARDPQVEARVVAANRSFRQLVEAESTKGKRIVLADMHSPDGPAIKDIGDDNVHPGDPGYKKMARIWYNAIEDAANRGFLSD